MAETRTKKSLMNTSVSLGFYILTLLVSIFARRIFLLALGDQLNGLIDTLSNILGMINLAELGIGTAIAYALYKPLHDKETKTINEIVSLQGWFYRRIALIVSLVAFGVMLFFPYIFKDLESPMWYAYATFLVSLWGAMMSYLINYRAIVFNADQRGYRITMNMQGFYLAKSILQTVGLYIFYKYDIPNPYVYYLSLEFIITLIGVYVLEKMIQKDYPWLKSNPKEGKVLLAKYKDVFKTIKQVFFHKFGSVVFAHISPLVILAFTSLKTLTFYGSYIILSKHLSSIISHFFSSITAGIGHLIAEGNKKKILGFFWEFLSVRNFTASIIAFSFYAYSSYLIPFWLGDKADYILPNIVVFTIAVSMYLNAARVMDIFLTAYGLFADIWSPIAEGLINVGFGLLFGYIFYHNPQLLGIDSAIYGSVVGVLLGSILSIIIIIHIWKAYYLFRDGFKISSFHLWKHYIKYPIISFAWMYCCKQILSWLALDFSSSLILFLINAVWTMTVFTILLFIIYYIMSQGMRDMTERFRIILIDKLIPNIKQKFSK